MIVDHIHGRIILDDTEKKIIEMLMRCPARTEEEALAWLEKRVAELKQED